MISERKSSFESSRLKIKGPFPTIVFGGLSFLDNTFHQIDTKSSRSKFDNMRSILKIKNPRSHFEDHLRSDVAGAMPTSHFENHLRSGVFSVVSLITEPELKETKRDFKRSSENEINIHHDGDNILNFSFYLE